MFLIQMVARVMRPGCQADYALLLAGDQGIRKSSALRTLVPEARYFTDNLRDIRNKDTSLHLQGHWLIEIAEQAAMRGTNDESKAFITRTVEKFRPPYGRHDVHQPRQCVFVLTTNNKASLQDETGDRRYWPVTATSIDIEGIERDREQLFAEAVVLFQRGEHWWPDQDFEREYIKPRQQAARASDVYEDVISEWLSARPQYKQTTIGMIANDALKIHDIAESRREQNRIMKALKALGWQRGEREGSNRWWLRGDAHDAPSDAPVTHKAA